MGRGILQGLEEMKRQLHAVEKQNKVKMLKKHLESQGLIEEREDLAAFPKIWMDDLQS